ncbi:hypothetical protein DFA_03606 [Cavenderia fasciculata]|uniref:ER-bound oxygenase mpaB/mpaB'/Rubber oxygenase catalytic domain-containing protein n=1 Tax=Cavenderia fasciculata TaxID=261658 RepID=F4PI74_CACFS|nr:uncharacterized protein DFA_03606 [Cavenderia fasciculata]EGG25357.1 hypothetical protein DFA_03606 [Cavenderia fasciculata]|eukprot:XP_004363208.1 hypothetical protein DFA_03606 [Cavenderia fasciculata]
MEGEEYHVVCMGGLLSRYISVSVSLISKGSLPCHGLVEQRATPTKHYKMYILYSIIFLGVFLSFFNYRKRSAKVDQWKVKLTKLDLSKPEDIDVGINYISTIDFPFELFISTNLAFYRTFCSPTISNVYYKTGTIEKTPDKRVNDTDLLMFTWMEHGLDSELGKSSYEQLNKIHGLHSSRTRNVDFIFVLCCLTIDAIQFCNDFGCRSLEEKEKQIVWEFYRRVGVRMNLADIPVTLEKCHQFVEDYTQDDRQSRVTQDGKVLTQAMTDLVVRWYNFIPSTIVKMGISVVLHYMSPVFHRKLDLPTPSATEITFIKVLLKLRRAAIQILPPRSTPHHLSSKLLDQDYGCPMSKHVFSKVGPIDMISKF